MKLLTTLLGLTLVALPALADDTKGPPRPAPKDNACKGTVIVGPGGSAYNGDGMMVTTGAASQGSCSLTPMNGTSSCKSKANAKAGWAGDVSGMDDNDSTSLTGPSVPGQTTTVGGTGGTVFAGPGVNALICNTAPLGGSNITVNTPTGTSTVPPQTSLWIHT